MVLILPTKGIKIFHRQSSIISIATTLLMPIILFGCSYGRGSLNLSEAEEQLRLKNYDQAIASYRAHIERRLAVKDRPSWENPHFYLMLIVDIELARNNIEGAEKALTEAQEKGVDATLIADRWRSFANWFEQRGRPREALHLLQTHRELDPLLFDSALDRLAKKIVTLEEQAPPELPAPKAPKGMESF